MPGGIGLCLDFFCFFFGSPKESLGQAKKEKDKTAGFKIDGRWQ
jgi:hypothetical protein